MRYIVFTVDEDMTNTCRMASDTIDEINSKIASHLSVLVSYLDEGQINTVYITKIIDTYTHEYISHIREGWNEIHDYD